MTAAAFAAKPKAACRSHFSRDARRPHVRYPQKVSILIYALFYVWLAAMAWRRATSAPAIPSSANVMSVLAQIVVTAGIVLSTFDDPRPTTPALEAAVPLLVLELAIEIVGGCRRSRCLQSGDARRRLAA